MAGAFWVIFYAFLIGCLHLQRRGSEAGPNTKECSHADSCWDPSLYRVAPSNTKLKKLLNPRRSSLILTPPHPPTVHPPSTPRPPSPSFTRLHPTAPSGFFASTNVFVIAREIRISFARLLIVRVWLAEKEYRAKKNNYCGVRFPIEGPIKH